VSKKAPGGEQAFEAWYGGLFAGRWPALRLALLEPVRHIAWQESLLEPYYLDPGSAAAALALPPPEEGRVLDMCAAPDGKTLILAGRLDPDSELTANEFSRERKNRLLTVLDGHLPPGLRQRVSVTGRDASRWSRYEQDAYDRILLDAPCSSERHVLSSPAYLAEWSPARIRNLAQRQWSLLSGAWLVLKEGGYLLYSTCALSPAENDGVAERLLKKYGDVAVIEPSLDTEVILKGMKGEKTRFGTHILPDSGAGAGPLYYVLFRKKNSSQGETIPALDYTITRN